MASNTDSCASVNKTTCMECNKEHALGGWFSCKATPCFGCGKLLCATCSGKYPLIPFNLAQPPDEANDLSKHNTFETFCKTCFQETSTLDFRRTYEVIGGDHGKPESMLTFVMVHGGGGSRSMFRPHAHILAEKYGYRSVLLDLPGHGSLCDVPLTLDSCLETVENVYEECNLSATQTIYVGASLGAYTGFHILSKMSDHFCGAVLIDCGQNVGPNASYKATAGIWLLGLITKYMSCKQITNAMLSSVVKSPARFKLIETCFGSGFFFEQGDEQVNCLHTVAPAEHIPHYSFPILFMNGSEDYRDSEKKWLDLCTHKEKSQLHVYQGGDHFFTHDDRFVSDILAKMDAFAKVVSEK